MNPSRGVVERRPLDGADLSPAVSIVSAVADAADTDVGDLDPLESVIPADALNRVARIDGTRLYFEYEGYTVDIDGGDSFAVYTADSDDGVTAADD